ncbi:MAG: hypothetical protein J6129_03235 [Bacteroidaceae bacterium]|nr:hypothetical protein [Bacteroidaceae bacterium]
MNTSSKDMYQHVLIMARYVNLGANWEEIGRVTFDVPLNERETRLLRSLLFTSEYFYPDNLLWHDNEMYHRIEAKAEGLLKAASESQPLGHIVMHWAEGERDRLLGTYRSLSVKDINEMISYLKNLGDETPSREKLLWGHGSFVWKEVWTRETGHMWENYTLLKRTPSKEELDYADCSQYAVWLSDLSTETIVNLLKGYKS